MYAVKTPYIARSAHASLSVVRSLVGVQYHMRQLRNHVIRHLRAASF